MVIGMPGGGDWGLQSPQYVESGAIYLAGTRNVTFDRCIFKVRGILHRSSSNSEQMRRFV